MYQQPRREQAARSEAKPEAGFHVQVLRVPLPDGGGGVSALPGKDQGSMRGPIGYVNPFFHKLFSTAVPPAGEEGARRRLRNYEAMMNAGHDNRAT